MAKEDVRVVPKDFVASLVTFVTGSLATIYTIAMQLDIWLLSATTALTGIAAFLRVVYLLQRVIKETKEQTLQDQVERNAEAIRKLKEVDADLRENADKAYEEAKKLAEGYAKTGKMPPVKPPDK